MITFEKATLEDASEIWTIQKNAFEEQARIYDNRNLPPLLQTLESLIEELDEKTFLKANVDGKIVGSVRFSVEDDEIRIERLIVDPRFQNMGIGSSLMKRVEALVGPKKIFKIFTGEKSSKNIRLYEKLGYRVYARTETSHGVALLHMKKTITNDKKIKRRGHRSGN